MTEKFTRNWDKIAVINIIILFVSLVLTIHNLHLVNQANILTEKNLELQNILSNFTSVISAEPEVGFLYSNTFDNVSNLITVSHYGHLKVSLKIITPHYGRISIEIKNFTEDSADMLNPNMKNQTTVSYVWEDEKYEDVVVPGLNSLTADLELKATTYPNPSKLPDEGEKIQFPIGHLLLEAKLYDVQTNKTLTKEFYAQIAVIIMVPWS